MRTHVMEAIVPHSSDEAMQLLDRLMQAIDRLKAEHSRLSIALKRLYSDTCAVRGEENSYAINQLMIRLRSTVRQFKSQLASHSRWEESELIPLAVWYFGNDMDVFTLMEQEHVLAEHYIDAFLMQVDQPPERPIDHVEAQRLASYLLQAYAILTNHFKEEEDMLDAFADQSNGYGF
ncbi:hemerythrin domain-containing protein [Cohnella lubricantis]|uniref:Hemerythrin domain-containing protein n=1 Tax=Cohnella lubricantis TaxID=2163172 RepID=A0A841T4W9_9BACL|nr:hemerythrin domain-containing protein [Cohnella lubricantis]MBB6676593.1 hemerythrin domain-containing protein [Cohnella lubricantis]MBP2117396.1 hypothetical protein [Cohnella lubricantis]